MSDNRTRSPARPTARRGAATPSDREKRGNPESNAMDSFLSAHRQVLSDYGETAAREHMLEWARNNRPLFVQRAATTWLPETR